MQDMYVFFFLYACMQDEVVRLINRVSGDAHGGTLVTRMQTFLSFSLYLTLHLFISSYLHIFCRVISPFHLRSLSSLHLSIAARTFFLAFLFLYKDTRMCTRTYMCMCRIEKWWHNKKWRQRYLSCMHTCTYAFTTKALIYIRTYSHIHNVPFL